MAKAQLLAAAAANKPITKDIKKPEEFSSGFLLLYKINNRQDCPITNGMRTFRLQQIKPNIPAKIHAIKIDPAGIGGGMLQCLKKVVLLGSYSQHAPTGVDHIIAVKGGSGVKNDGLANIFRACNNLVF